MEKFFELAIQFIRPELIILIPILYYIGVVVKKSEKVADWVIPLVLLGVSLLFSVSYVIIVEGGDAMAVWMGFMQGFAIWAVEGAGYATGKQIINRNKS